MTDGESGNAWLGPLLGAVAVAVAARVSLPIPGSPVPVSLQTLAVFVVGGWLGSRDAGLAMALYLALAAAGLPVLSDGAGGLGAVLGPTAGYLVGFVLAAVAIGRAQEVGWLDDVPRASLVAAAGTALVLVPGVSWLALGVGLGWQRALEAGALPHLPGALAKGLVAIAVWRGLQTRREQALTAS